MGLVLHPCGSAAGVDGKPYELYQIAPAGASCLVGQAVLAGVHGPWAVRHVIGDDPDLLIWIPKGLAQQVAALVHDTPLESYGSSCGDRGYRPEHLRPLQLPICLKKVPRSILGHFCWTCD